MYSLLFVLILAITSSDAKISKVLGPNLISLKFQRSHASLMMIDSSKSSISQKSPKIIIAGAPASGKGTQCEIIKKEFGVIHLSTGDILRAAVTEKSDLGLKAKEYMDSGKLVPDELIINVVVDRLKQTDCQNNGLLFNVQVYIDI